MTAREQQDHIWSKILENATSGEYDQFKVMTQSLMTTFENHWDVFPAGRVRSIHGIGVVCPIAIKIENSPYTGILKNGEVFGLIR